MVEKWFIIYIYDLETIHWKNSIAAIVLALLTVNFIQCISIPFKANEKFNGERVKF